MIASTIHPAPDQMAQALLNLLEARNDTENLRSAKIVMSDGRNVVFDALSVESDLGKEMIQEYMTGTTEGLRPIDPAVFGVKCAVSLKLNSSIARALNEVVKQMPNVKAWCNTQAHEPIFMLQSDVLMFVRRTNEN